MNPGLKKYYKPFLKSVLLLCVYSLHLVFFQNAMAAKDNTSEKYFKTYLSHKADTKKGKASPAGFYLQFIKLTSNAERPTVSAPGDILNHITPVIAVANELPPVSQWFVYAHLPDDAFKIFQRIRVFLI